MTIIRIQKVTISSISFFLLEPLYKSGFKEEYFSLKIPDGHIPVQVNVALNPSITLVNLAFFSENTHEIKLASNMDLDELAKLYRPFDKGVWFYQLPVKELILDLDAKGKNDVLTNLPYIRPINRGDY